MFGFVHNILLKHVSIHKLMFLTVLQGHRLGLCAECLHLPQS